MKSNTSNHSIVSLVVKYLPSKQMSGVRFPDNATASAVLHTPCRGGLVGYDAAFTQLRSGVRFPSPVRGFFLFHTAVVDDACLFMMTD